MWDQPDRVGAGGESVEIGDLSFRLVQQSSAVQIHLDGGVLDAPDMPAAGWHSAVVRGQQPVCVQPATPDLPVVVRTQRPLSLSPGSEFSTVVRVPLWIRICLDAASGSRQTSYDIADIPTRRLKRTWFGPVDTGEVAYSWWFNPGELPDAHDHYFLVPLTISNQSQTLLRFERMLLRAVHLDLFLIDGRLESNRVTIAFKGTDQLSHITFESEVAVRARGGRFVAAHRVDANQDIIRRSFHWLRDL